MSILPETRICINQVPMSVEYFYDLYQEETKNVSNRIKHKSHDFYVASCDEKIEKSDHKIVVDIKRRYVDDVIYIFKINTKPFRCTYDQYVPICEKNNIKMLQAHEIQPSTMVYVDSYTLAKTFMYNIYKEPYQGYVYDLWLLSSGIIGYDDFLVDSNTRLIFRGSTWS